MDGVGVGVSVGGRGVSVGTGDQVAVAVAVQATDGVAVALGDARVDVSWLGVGEGVSREQPARDDTRAANNTRAEPRRWARRLELNTG